MTHPAKRPYTGSIHQPSITSYFSSSTSPPPTTTTSSPSTIPALPPNVQSNLLSVGMRVRKSVPEGYKTGNYSAFTLFSDSTPPPATIQAQDKVKGDQRVKTRPRAGARELTPFCGILKVGGMAQQQWGIYNSGSSSAMYDDEEEDEDDFPGLSQGSTDSNVSVESSAGHNKRRFFEDGEEEVEAEVSGERERALGERVLAVPRRKRWVGAGKVPDTGAVSIVGQKENLGFGGTGGQEDMDFEEAEFLDYGLVGEVEMSG